MNSPKEIANNYIAIGKGKVNTPVAKMLSLIHIFRCFTPTFSDTEFPPQEPQPNVKDGVILKL